MGGGLALALAADFRISSDDAQFSIPEIDIGIPLAWGATPRLIAEIGAAKAREMILMCDPVDATEAARLGLVHRSVPAADLDTTLAHWVERLVAKPEQAVHMERSKFRAYAVRSTLGDVTETDGEMMLSASRSPRAKQSFGGLT